MKCLVTAFLLIVLSVPSFGAIEIYEFKSAEDEARYQALIEELRCPKCQNQNLAGSDAPIAVDLKNQTYQMINDGRSDTEIRAYMFERYGDFISYKPPVRPSTWILWLFPPILLIVSLIGWLLYTAKQKQKISEQVDILSDSEEAQLRDILKNHQTSKKDLP